MFGVAECPASGTDRFLWTGEMGLEEREIMATLVIVMEVEMEMKWAVLMAILMAVLMAVLVEVIQRLLLVTTPNKEISPLEAAQRDILGQPSALG